MSLKLCLYKIWVKKNTLASTFGDKIKKISFPVMSEDIQQKRLKDHHTSCVKEQLANMANKVLKVILKQNTAFKQFCNKCISSLCSDTLKVFMFIGKFNASLLWMLSSQFIFQLFFILSDYTYLRSNDIVPISQLRKQSMDNNERTEKQTYIILHFIINNALPYLLIQRLLFLC